MTEIQTKQSQQWDVLSCSCIIHRAASNSPHRDKVTGKILRLAFLRRGPKDDGTLRDTAGLSVNLFPEETLLPEQIVEKIKSSMNRCYAVASLHTGLVRDIDSDPKLDVIRDRIDHANIEGLPAFGENDAEAERLATILADQARTIWVRD